MDVAAALLIAEGPVRIVDAVVASRRHGAHCPRPSGTRPGCRRSRRPEVLVIAAETTTTSAGRTLADDAPVSVVGLIRQAPFLRSACLALFISGVGVSATMPQMTLFLVNEIHLPLAVAGFYYLVNLMAPVAGFTLGSLSDRLTNRLTLYRLCALLAALGWVSMALANRPWLPFLIGIVALSFGGASMGQLFAATRDELTRHPTPVNSRVVAAVRMSFSAGWIMGPVLGSWFGAAFGLRPLMFATAACAVGQILPLGRRRVERAVAPLDQATPVGDDERHDGRAVTPTQASLTPLLVFLGCCVLLMSGDTMKFAYLPLYMDQQLHVSDALRGAVIAVQPLLELGLMPLFARLADKIKPIRVLTIGALLGVAAHLAYATSTSVAGLFAGQVLMSGLWAAVAGLGITVAQQLSPRRIGLASSLFTSCIPLAGAVGGSLGAAGVVLLGIPHLYFLPAVLTSLGGMGLLLVTRRYRPDDTAFLSSAPPDLTTTRPTA